ncbi:hypothetical protein CLV58_109105 [Spirosoma oryzae]|uniref:Uncharacterized protein n=1 Tax=Spirosoma oryzae TaxID=1469603 RepID=A0A2T0SY86_9BACT|nr:hypothetical protein [Spirosoma oryzae]PRY38378.1 hypothetical protein CLV58_109105 [Spirosoma oryzae]
MTQFKTGDKVRLVREEDNQLFDTDYQLNRIYTVGKVVQPDWFEVLGLPFKKDLDPWKTYRKFPRIYNCCFEKLDPFQVKVLEARNQLKANDKCSNLETW